MTQRRAPALLAVACALLFATRAVAAPLDDGLDAAAEGRWREAADHFAKAVEADPQNREAALGLGRAVVEGKKWELFLKAEAPLRAMHQADAEDTEVQLALARLFGSRAPVEPQSFLRAALYARARAHYVALVEKHPDLEDAAVGLARVQHENEESDAGIATLDAFLARKPESPARALFEKGRILYQMARAAHAAVGGGYPLTQLVRRFYARCQGACMASTKVDPRVFDAWMHIGWASSVLADRETAREAYEKAYALDPKSPLPLKGLVALDAHDPEAKARALERLSRLAPAKRRQEVAKGYELLAATSWEELRAFFEAYVREYGEDADALYCLGKVDEAQGREALAIDRYERALKLDGSHERAAEELDRRIRPRAIQRARNSVAAARELYADYAHVMALAPRNPYVRNNAAFALREAWKKHQADPKWKEILILSAKTYEEAARAIGPWRPEKETEIPWSRRYGLAQIVNDTGIVFQIFEPTRDYERAERYLLRALRYVSWGYLDAWTYLRKIYEEQERWQDLHDLALRCAEGLAKADGKPHEAAREAAKKLAERLVDEGKAN